MAGIARAVLRITDAGVVAAGDAGRPRHAQPRDIALTIVPLADLRLTDYADAHFGEEALRGHKKRIGLTGLRRDKHRIDVGEIRVALFAQRVLFCRPRSE